jgi:hypothetical protein
MLRLILLSTILFSSVASSKVIGRKYFNQFLGHVHKNMSKGSASLTIIQCSQSVRILENKLNDPEWMYVNVGDETGYVHADFLSEKKPDCFQARYPKFYNEMQLDITEMYLWGRLYDQYLIGKSKVK